MIEIVNILLKIILEEIVYKMCCKNNELIVRCMVFDMYFVKLFIGLSNCVGWIFVILMFILVDCNSDIVVLIVWDDVYIRVDCIRVLLIKCMMKWL